VVAPRRCSPACRSAKRGRGSDANPRPRDVITATIASSAVEGKRRHRRSRSASGSLRQRHFQGPTAGVDLVVMGEIGEALEDAEQALVPGAAQELHLADAALRAEGTEPRQLVATLRRRADSEGAQRAHQMLRLALASLPRVPTEPDHDPLAR